MSPVSTRSISLTHYDPFRYPNSTLLSQAKLPSDHADRLHQFHGLSVQSRRASRLAQAILPRPGTTAETYVAYGLTQKLFEACSSQADYIIPQVSQKGVTVPRNEAGEDLGVGEGWWYKGLLSFGSWVR